MELNKTTSQQQKYNIIKTIYNKNNTTINIVQHKITLVNYITKKSNNPKLSYNEIEILKKIRHPFIINLYSINRHKELYMDFCIGGNLNNLTKLIGTKNNNRFTGITEISARYYILSVLFVLQYLGNKNIIHRDIKAENIVINYDGTIKVIDFAFSKVLIEDKTYTRYGTIDYASPELLLHKGYNCLTDIWSTGVLLFELTCGYFPYNYYIDKECFTSRIRYPYFYSDCLKDIISLMLEQNVEYRLSANDLLNHEFFNQIDKMEVVNKIYRPPFIPKVSSCLDFKYLNV